MKSLIVVFSYHHRNTENVARAMAGALGAPVRTPAQTSASELAGSELVGFGSGIDSGHHYKPLLDFVDGLPLVSSKPAFIFSTCGVPGALVNDDMLARQIAGNHRALRQKLQGKGYVIVDEFGCLGFNTNSFLKWFGGVNRGRPDAVDLHRAEAFAAGVVRKAASR